MKRFVLIIVIATSLALTSAAPIYAENISGDTKKSPLIFSGLMLNSNNQKAIEIRNISQDIFSLDALRIMYASSSKDSFFDSLELLRLHGTIDANQSMIIAHEEAVFDDEFGADMRFDSTAPSMSAGALALVDSQGYALDTICWATSATTPSLHNCHDETGALLPKRQSGEVWYRDLDAGEFLAGVYTMQGGGYVPFENKCEGMRLSEISPRSAPQFLEIYNETNQNVSLEGCHAQVNASTHVFGSEDYIPAGGFLTIDIEKTSLRLNKTTQNEVAILNTHDEEVDGPYELFSLKEGASMIYLDGQWHQTFAPTPNQENKLLEYEPCEGEMVRSQTTSRCIKPIIEKIPTPCDVGKTRNPETGRCIALLEKPSLATCAANQVRNPETNRCRLIVTPAVNALIPCKENQFRNPETNRCKAIVELASAKLCPEGQSRNLETNRCRKDAAENIGASLSYRSQGPVASSTRFVGWPLVFSVIGGAVLWVIWDFRNSFAKIFVRKTIQ